MTCSNRNHWLILLTVAVLPLGSCNTSSDRSVESEVADDGAAAAYQEYRQGVEVSADEIPWRSRLAASDAPARRAMEKAQVGADGRAQIGSWVIVDAPGQRAETTSTVPQPVHSDVRPVEPVSPGPTVATIEPRPAPAVRPTPTRVRTTAPPQPQLTREEARAARRALAAGEPPPARPRVVPKPVALEAVTTTRPPAPPRVAPTPAVEPAPVAPRPQPVETTVSPVDPSPTAVQATVDPYRVEVTSPQPVTVVAPAPPIVESTVEPEPVEVMTPEPTTVVTPRVVEPEPARTPEPAPEPEIVRSVEATIVRTPEPEEFKEGHLVEVMVGQISGFPVYASEVFKDLGEESLVRTGEELSRLEFRSDVSKRVYLRLIEVMTDSLLLAEAEKGLSEQERMGLLGFLAEEREKLLATGLGAPSVAEDVLQRRLGRSIEEQLKFQRDRMVTSRYLQEKLHPKIVVTRRDIERHYQDNIATYKPNPSVTIRLMLVHDERTADEVDTALSAGAPFEQVASAYSTFKPNTGGLMDPVQTSLSEFGALGWDELNEQVRILGVQQHSPRIRVDDRRIGWVYLEAIQASEPRELRDVYLEIEDKLRLEQFDLLNREYMAELVNEDKYYQIESMVGPLVEVAMNRFARPE